MAKFIISRRTNFEWQFKLLADNGQIILLSEGYTTRTSCEAAVASVKSNALSDNNYIRKTSVNMKYYFVLKALNGEIIGTSELYESQAGRENGISAVKKYAPSAWLEVLSH